ncbi:hypothetical protein AUP68_14006 [Ilyonectria robusta]
MSPRDKRCHKPRSALGSQHTGPQLSSHFAAFQAWPGTQHTEPGPGAENVAEKVRPRRNVTYSPSGSETLVTVKSPQLTHSGKRSYRGAIRTTDHSIACPEGTTLPCLALGDYIHRYGLKPLLFVVSEIRPVLDNLFPSAGPKDGGLVARLTTAISWVVRCASPGNGRTYVRAGGAWRGCSEQLAHTKDAVRTHDSTKPDEKP